MDLRWLVVVAALLVVGFLGYQWINHQGTSNQGTDTSEQSGWQRSDNGTLVWVD